jgi:arylsulfatase A-like enzyme
MKNCSRRTFLKLAGAVSVAMMSGCNPIRKRPFKPNLVLIFCDDLGYGDLGCYGSTVHKTPHLDRMAREGVKFTDFYVTCGVCTPSRASLMTGCYPRRVDMHVNARPEGEIGRQVLFPRAKKGLNPSEVTIAEILKDQGYATACIGKWHLGDQPGFLPTEQGFDTYFGIPYSNDMNRDFCPLPLMQDTEVIEAPVNQDTLTKRYTEKTIEFIKTHADESFFIYLPHAMTHNPLHASEEFRGSSENGLYGDAVQEIDWSTGEILDSLEDLGIAENTLVIFTSDNGAASRWGGSNLPLSGWKGGTMEGSMREPCIMWWPGTIPANSVCTELASTMDILPTMAELAGGKVPADRIIDGKDIFDLMTDENTKTPHKVFYYYQKEQLMAVRSGPWKLHLALDKQYKSVHYPGFKKGRPLKLVNLDHDIQEQYDVSQKHPDIVKRLQKLADAAREDLGDLGVQGKNQRPAAIVDHPVAQLKK